MPRVRRVAGAAARRGQAVDHAGRLRGAGTRVDRARQRRVERPQRRRTEKTTTRRAATRARCWSAGLSHRPHQVERTAVGAVIAVGRHAAAPEVGGVVPTLGARSGAVNARSVKNRYARRWGLPPTLPWMRADNASDSAGPRNDPAGGDAATADSDPVSDPAAGLLTTPQSPDELIAEYDEERPGRRLSAGWTGCVGRGLLRGLGVRAVAGVRAAAARQPVLPDPVPGRGAAAGLRLLPRPASGAAADAGAATTPASSTGCSPRWPCWSASTRCCRSTLGDSGGGFDAFLDRQGSLTALDIVMGAVLTAAGAGGLPAHHRAGAADHLRGVLPLRLLRRLPADHLADRARRVRLQPDHQRLLQRPVRLLRHPAGRLRHLHRAVHDLRRGAGRDRRRAGSSST